MPGFVPAGWQLRGRLGGGRLPARHAVAAFQHPGADTHLAPSPRYPFMTFLTFQVDYRWGTCGATLSEWAA